MTRENLAGKAVFGARVFDGAEWHDDEALMVGEDGRVAGLLPAGSIPAAVPRLDLGGELVVPGFIDLQVNGGGGVLFNDAPSVEGIGTICRAHGRFGTTALLPTLITDTPEASERALEAGAAAAAARVPGFLGLHMEGPHLSTERKGAHDPGLIRPMEETDFQMLARAVKAMPVLMMTVAPETVGTDEIGRLAEMGVRVSLGHSNATCGVARAAAGAGASMVTHLFNAMSPLGHREPGMVGNALDNGGLSAGLIADGIHVDPVAIQIALRAKRGPGHIFLVTDAMATIGTDLPSFTLNGRPIHRKDGSLRLADGTLAGADIDMLASVRFMHDTVGLPLEEALRMASRYPAEAVGRGAEMGHLKAGARASFVHLTESLEFAGAWIDGVAAAS